MKSWQTFLFRDYNEDSPWSWKPLTQKSMPSAGHRERLLKLAKCRWDLFAKHVLSNFEHLRQSTSALSCFSKDDKYFLFFFFLERQSSP